MTTRLPPGVTLGKDDESEEVLSDSSWAHPEDDEETILEQPAPTESGSAG